MENNNNRPVGGTGVEVPEPPEEAARVKPEPQPAPSGQLPLSTPTYPLYPPPETTHTPYTQQQLPSQPIAAQQGISPVTAVLSILGAVVVLGLIFVIAVMLVVSNIVGQVTNPTVGDLRTETQSIALGEAQSVVVDIDMGVGKLNVAGNANELMDATFTYNIESWKPVLSYDVKGTEGTLLVRQPNQGTISTSPGTRYEWNLYFKNDVPMTMRVNVGVGDGDLKFGGLDLSRLEVNSGVGNTTIDLTGQWTQDLDVLVKGGVGQVTIILPQDTGVRVTAEGGLGHVTSSGLTVNGKTYTNAAYGVSAATINIDVSTGVGNIQLVQGR